jgi:putative transcriptional regulator
MRAKLTPIADVHRDNGRMQDSLRGRLLIAAPSLHDHFRRAVVLVIEHSDEGAMGVVLNRVSETPVSDAVPTLGELAGDEELVRIGGPVGQQSVVALGDFEDPAEAGTLVVGTVGVLDPDRLDPDLRRMRVYAGYAGWAGGQLEGEVEQGAWIVDDADPEDPFRDDDLWAAVLERKGGSYALLASMPADPSLN